MVSNKKLSIYFGEDKTKSIPSTSKRRAKNIRQLNIKYKSKYKTAFGSNISWMGAGQDKLRIVNDIGFK